MLKIQFFESLSLYVAKKRRSHLVKLKLLSKNQLIQISSYTQKTEEIKMWKNRATEEVQVQHSRARHVVSCYIRLAVLVRILYICSHVPTTVSNTRAKNCQYLVSTIRGSQLELVACFQCVSEYIQISFVILINVMKSFFPNQFSQQLPSKKKISYFQKSLGCLKLFNNIFTHWVIPYSS